MLDDLAALQSCIATELAPHSNSQVATVLTEGFRTFASAARMKPVACTKGEEAARCRARARWYASLGLTLCVPSDSGSAAGGRPATTCLCGPTLTASDQQLRSMLQVLFPGMPPWVRPAHAAC